MTARSGRFKLMKDRTLPELEQTIRNAEQIGQVIANHCGLMVNPFWEMCAGIDAYFEKRRRRALTDPLVAGEQEKRNTALEEQLRSSIIELEDNGQD